MCWAHAVYHQHCLPSSRQVQNNPWCTQDPSSGTWLTLLWSSRDIQDVQITSAIHGAKYWMDHRLVRSFLKLCIAPTQQKHPKLLDHHSTWPDWDTPTTTTGFRKHSTRSSRPVHPMLKTALRSGVSLRRLSRKQQQSCLGSREMQTSGLVQWESQMHQSAAEKNQAMWSGKMTQAPNQWQINSDISEDKARRDCTRWKTIGGTEKQMKCKSMQTQTTPNSSLEL